MDADDNILCGTPSKHNPNMILIREKTVYNPSLTCDIVEIMWVYDKESKKHKLDVLIDRIADSEIGYRIAGKNYEFDSFIDAFVCYMDWITSKKRHEDRCKGGVSRADWYKEKWLKARFG